MNVKNLKKIELHLHLDGSVREKTAKNILGYSVNLKANEKCEDLKEYLTMFDIPIKLMQTKENLEIITKELIEDLISDNVIYAEIRFSPLDHIRGGLSLNEVVETVLDSIKSDKIKTKLILCMRRDFEQNQNMKVIDIAYKYNLPVDLVGDEANYNTSKYKDLFLYANSKGLKYTIHSGEADGASSINKAIEFGAKRLGHGIRAIESNECIKKLIDNNITLEVCPTSNVQTDVIKSYKDHPIKKLMDLGVLVTVSTDNNTVSNITLSEEYQKLVDNFNFTKEDFLRINLNAIEAAFTSTENKEILKKEILQNYKI
ncbi:MAG: adenosine deaminase [bacterium]|nr:adenosine deaminase [bacterium]